jgi:uncharacterized protein (DUF736 family)
VTAYDNSNTGVLFPNDRKVSPNQPDFTGSVILSKELIMYVTREIGCGREPKLAIKGWKKTSKAGKGFVSLVAEEPWDGNKVQQPRAEPWDGNKAQQPRADAPQRQAPSAFDDDVPF